LFFFFVEKVMKNIVGDRRKGQTVLTIAHRLSSVKNADLIIFVGKDGTIQELGTWNDLLELENGKFANAVRIQNL
jgi:ABC-type transport system involved in Fe-S cluster assembly fused permease/ATPase subunit